MAIEIQGGSGLNFRILGKPDVWSIPRIAVQQYNGTKCGDQRDQS